MSNRIVINPITCDGHGMCAEMLPELIDLDDWGYPIVRSAEVPPHLRATARRARQMCPMLALLLPESA